MKAGGIKLKEQIYFYCCKDYISRNEPVFIKGKRYLLYYEEDDFYTIFDGGGIIERFYKNDLILRTKTGENGTPLSHSYKVFTDFFYTEQEYNRYKNLNELLDEE